MFILAEASTQTPGLEDAQQLMEEVVSNPSVLSKYASTYGPGILKFLVQVVIAVLVLVIGMKVIKGVVGLITKSMNRHGVESGVVSFLSSLIRYALDFVLIMFVLAAFGLSGSVVAVLGSAGLTVGLALQGSLSNFAGGVLILMLKPFVVGDYIVDQAGGQEGFVESISIFYTKLLTVDNRMIMIPNGALSNSIITNVSRMENRRIDLVLSVDYSSDLSLVKAVLNEVAISDDAVLKDEPIDIYVDKLAESSIDMGLRVWVKNEDYWTAKWRITERVKNRFDEAHISIPYPHMEIKMKQQ